VEEAIDFLEQPYCVVCLCMLLQDATDNQDAHEGHKMGDVCLTGCVSY
jgi:hypothetical protein